MQRQWENNFKFIIIDRMTLCAINCSDLKIKVKQGLFFVFKNMHMERFYGLLQRTVSPATVFGSNPDAIYWSYKVFITLVVAS